MTAYLADKADKPSHERMTWAWKRLQDDFGHLRPDQITRQKCREYVAKRRRRGRGDNTIRKELTTLRSALRWNDKNTPAVVEMPPMPTPREVFITKADRDKLIESAIAPHMKLFIQLAWFTAGRKDSILALEWDHVDFERGVIDLGQGVGNKRRAKPPISPTLRTALLDAYKARTTRNLRSRYRALNTMAPHGINRVWYLAGAGRAEEVALHREFKDQRIGGEWFDPCRAILAKIIYGGCCEVRRIAGRVTGQVCSWDLP